MELSEVLTVHLDEIGLVLIIEARVLALSWLSWLGSSKPSNITRTSLSGDSYICPPATNYKR